MEKIRPWLSSAPYILHFHSLLLLYLSKAILYRASVNPWHDSRPELLPSLSFRFDSRRRLQKYAIKNGFSDL